MEEKEYPLQFYDDLVGLELHIECCSWEYEFAAKIWGPNLGGKTAVGIIKKVTQNRKTKKPKFEVFVKDTNETYTNLDLDYVWKYSPEVPLKYHELKADYIVRLSRQAGYLWMPEGQQAAEDNSTNSTSNKDGINTVTEDASPIAPAHSSAEQTSRKRGGKEPRQKGKAKKQAVAAAIDTPPRPKTSELSEELIPDSDAEEEDVSEEFWDAMEADDDGNDEGLEDDVDQDFINWQRDTPPVQLEKPFTGMPGPKHTLSPEASTPFDYFSLFIPIFFWPKIASYTNIKAQMQEEKTDGETRSWSPTCGAEIKAWFASVMWWCLVRNCTFEQFHQNVVNPIYCSKWFPSMKRWQQIKRFLKLSDPRKDNDNKHNKLFKIQELYDTFIQACRAYYYPNREVSVDEAVKKFKGRCIFKQYIKGKPVRFGIKIFCVCCSATSYLFNAIFYLGKTGLEAPKEASVTHETVVSLMQPLAGNYHRVYMDNYYTGLPLFKELEGMQIHATGTVRTNRKGLDKEVTIKQNEERHLKKNPGQTRYSSSGRYVYAAWFDKRAVHMLSNCHQPVAGPEDVVEHWYPAKAGEANAVNGKVKREISICPLVRWYRKWMGGVDRFDQFRAYIKLEMRTGKFWFPMMWFIMESALVNAWIIYKATRELAGLPLQFTNFEFRVSIARSLAAEWEMMGCVYNPGAMPSSPNSILKTTKASKLQALLGSSSDSKCSDENKHLDRVEDIPLLDQQKTKNRRQLRCRSEGCKSRTSKWCRTCHTPLCWPDCYVKFHLK
jgi:hypothetical protein